MHLDGAGFDVISQDRNRSDRNKRVAGKRQKDGGRGAVDDIHEAEAGL